MIKNYMRRILEKIEGKRFISDRFHDLTSNKKLAVNIKTFPQSWVKVNFKTYPRLDRIKFSNMEIPTNKFSEILKKRRSTRQFSGDSISKKELCYLLFSSCGLINLDQILDNSRRPYPSAGARYPLEVYPIILNCEGVEKGLYHYNVKENSLELLFKKDLGEWIMKTTGGEKWITNTAVVFIITGVLDRTRIKYEDRGYRYTLIEAGHLGQNICLLATQIGLGSCPLGGFIDHKVDTLLDINLQKEVALYIIAIGKI